MTLVIQLRLLVANFTSNYFSEIMKAFILIHIFRRIMVYVYRPSGLSRFVQSASVVSSVNGNPTSKEHM